MSSEDKNKDAIVEVTTDEKKEINQEDDVKLEAVIAEMLETQEKASLSCKPITGAEYDQAFND